MKFATTLIVAVVLGVILSLHIFSPSSKDTTVIDCQEEKIQAENYDDTDINTNKPLVEESINLEQATTALSISPENLDPIDRKIAERIVLGAIVEPKVTDLMSEVMGRMTREKNGNSTVPNTIHTTLLSDEVQAELLIRLTPIFAKAPYYWQDEQTADFIKSVCQGFGKDLNDAYEPSDHLAISFLSEEEWETLYNRFCDIVDENRFIVACSLGRQEANKKLSPKEKGENTMLDDKVQKMLKKKMTPELSAPPYSWTPVQIDDFIRSASGIFGTMLAKSLEEEHQKSKK
jgi:hypothetical protein